MSNKKNAAQAFEEEQTKESKNVNDLGSSKKVAAITIVLHENHRFSIMPATNIDGKEFKADFSLLHLFKSYLGKMCNRIELGEAINNIFTVERQEIDENGNPKESN